MHWFVCTADLVFVFSKTIIFARSKIRDVTQLLFEQKFPIGNSFLIAIPYSNLELLLSTKQLFERAVYSWYIVFYQMNRTRGNDKKFLFFVWFRRSSVQSSKTWNNINNCSLSLYTIVHHSIVTYWVQLNLTLLIFHLMHHKYATSGIFHPCVPNSRHRIPLA